MTGVSQGTLAQPLTDCANGKFQSCIHGVQDSLGPRTVVFLSDVETDVWTAGTVEQLAGVSSRWLVTRGEDGADELTPRGFTHLPAVEVGPCSHLSHLLSLIRPRCKVLLCHMCQVTSSKVE
jgi:hypothetical protein